MLSFISLVVFGCVLDEQAINFKTEILPLNNVSMLDRYKTQTNFKRVR